MTTVPNVTHMTVSMCLYSSGNRGHLKGTVSGQKALQGIETETGELVGGREENILSYEG